MSAEMLERFLERSSIYVLYCIEARQHLSSTDATDTSTIITAAHHHHYLQQQQQQQASLADSTILDSAAITPSHYTGLSIIRSCKNGLGYMFLLFSFLQN